MKIISSAAGTRLAKARHEYLRALRDGGSALEQYAAKLEYEIAADKVDDTNAVDACSACHAVLDGPSSGWPPGEYAHREWYLLRALSRTIRNRVMRGILTLEDFTP